MKRRGLMKRFFYPSYFLKYVLVLLLLAPLPLISQVKAIKARKIYSGTQGVIEKGVILIENGKIVDIGEEAKIPWNAEVIDYGQKGIMPDLGETHARGGYEKCK